MLLFVSPVLSLPALPVTGELALSLSKGPGEPACPEPVEGVEWVEGPDFPSRSSRRLTQ